jgi:hypothetical protein
MRFGATLFPPLLGFFLNQALTNAANVRQQLGISDKVVSSFRPVVLGDGRLNE